MAIPTTTRTLSTSRKITRTPTTARVIKKNRVISATRTPTKTTPTLDPNRTEKIYGTYLNRTHPKYGGATENTYIKEEHIYKNGQLYKVIKREITGNAGRGKAKPYISELIDYRDGQFYRRIQRSKKGSETKTYADGTKIRTIAPKTLKEQQETKLQSVLINGKRHYVPKGSFTTKKDFQQNLLRQQEYTKRFKKRINESIRAQNQWKREHDATRAISKGTDPTPYLGVLSPTIHTGKRYQTGVKGTKDFLWDTTKAMPKVITDFTSSAAGGTMETIARIPTTFGITIKDEHGNPIIKTGKYGSSDPIRIDRISQQQIDAAFLHGGHLLLASGIKPIQTATSLGLGGYGAIEAQKGIYETDPERLAGGSLMFGAVAAQYGMKPYYRLTGQYRPEIITTRSFPKEPRPTTIERLKGQERIRVATSTATEAGSRFLGQDVRYGTTPPKSQYATAEEYGHIRTGDVFLSPKRDPTYWQNQIRNLIKGKPLLRNPETGKIIWSLKKPQTVIRDVENKVKIPKNAQEYYDSIKKLEGSAITAPKTLAKLPQPESEVLVVPKLGERTNIGKGSFGQDIVFEGTNIPAQYETPLKRVISSWKSQIAEGKNYAKFVSEVGKTKQKQIEANNPLGDAWDNSGRTHVQRIKEIGRQQSKESRQKINEELLDAFAEVHDIWKEPNYNFRNDKAIATGIQQGYYDDLKSVSKLNAAQKEKLARLILLDEKPPVNLVNMNTRTEQTIKYSPYYLDAEAKIIINADRLARFGDRADPYMIFEISNVNKAQIIRDSGTVRDIKYAQQLKNADSAYQTIEYNNNVARYGEYMSPENYAAYGRYARPYTTTYAEGYAPYQYKVQQQPYAIPVYATPYKPHMPTPYTTPYVPNYVPVVPPTTPTPPIITTPPIIDKPKEQQKKIKPSTNQEEAYTPTIYTSSGEVINTDLLYDKEEKAKQSGMHIVDKAPYTYFGVHKVTKDKGKAYNKAVQYTKTYKFRKRGNLYRERRPYRFDTKTEKQPAFNVFDYVKIGA